VDETTAEPGDLVGGNVEQKAREEPLPDWEALLPEPDWVEWYALTPAERWAATDRLWAQYLVMGGSLDPEPDTQSPFFDPEAPGAVSPDGRTGVHLLRRGGV
jgi:hypothetical protein